MLYALELFDMKKYSQALTEFDKLNTDPADVIKLFPELDGKSNEEKLEVKKIKCKDLDIAINALIQYLLKLKKNILEQSHEPLNSQTETVKESHKEQLELIDTTLLKCYLEVNGVILIFCSVALILLFIKGCSFTLIYKRRKIHQEKV